MCSSSAVRKAWARAPLRALRRSGRLSTTRATPASSSRSRISSGHSRMVIHLSGNDFLHFVFLALVGELGELGRDVLHEQLHRTVALLARAPLLAGDDEQAAEASAFD